MPRLAQSALQSIHTPSKQQRLHSILQTTQRLYHNGPLPRPSKHSVTNSSPHMITLPQRPFLTPRIPNAQHLPRDRRLSSTSSSRSPPSSEPSTSNRFTYALAASYCGKRSKFKPTEHNFTFSPTQNSRFRSGIALPTITPSAGRLASGQDAVFVSNVGSPSTGSIAFGVADGVGGWQDQGIDSAAFAHGLCGYMEEGAKWYQSGSKASGDAAETTALTPDALLKLGYERVCNDRSIHGGGSTACIGILSPSGYLRVANLGDSGFVQLRGRKVQYYSDPQTHAFNTPYQLSHTPPKLLAQMEKFGAGAPFSDMPGDASVTGHEMGHGDVVVFATDGVWDNLSSQDLLGIVCKRMEGEGAWIEGSGEKGGTGVADGRGGLTGEMGERSLQMLVATDVVQAAKDAGLNSRRDGPFAKAVQKAFPTEGYRGGKPDDIGVVVAIAIDESAAADGSSSQRQSKL